MDIGLVFPGCNKRGGVERNVWELAANLSQRHAVTVYATDIDEHGLERATLVHVEGASTPFAFARAARASLARRTHDHVISFGVGDVGADVYWVGSVHRSWIRQSLKFPVKDGLHRLPFLRYLSPRHQVLLAAEWVYFTRGHPKRVVTVADKVGEDVHRLYGVPRELLATVHNGFSPAEFAPEIRHSLREAARAEFGYGPRDVVALIVANELPRKGFDELISAQAALGDPRLHALLVGRAPLSAGYCKRISQLGLEGRITYAGSRSDMDRMHAAADLFVLPTKYEAFCLAIIEALASGLPVITTDVPGAGDRVVDGVNGRLLRDPTSIDGLRSLLAEGVKDETRATWAAAASESVADLTWGAIAEQAEHLLEALPRR